MKFITFVPWEDAPHLDEKAREDLAKSYMPHELQARTKGKPSIGSGAIYPVPEEDILCDPFEFPAWYRHCYALDVGWNRTAALWLAYSQEDDTAYAYAEYYRGSAEPPVHAAAIKARGDWIPGTVDPASRGRSQADGTALFNQYTDLGLVLTPANNAREAGIYEVWSRLSTGRIKVFKTLQNFRGEYGIYRRDEKGSVVKAGDHLMDCFDSQTDALTESGWIPFSALTGEERLATVNLDTDLIEYQQPSQLIAKDYAGPMVRFGGHKLDGLTTPGHRMVVYPRDHDRPVFKEAGALTIWDRLKLHAHWKGIERSSVAVEGACGRFADIDPIVWAELLGWYVAEGCCERVIQTPGRGYSVYISQCKQVGVDHLRRLLAQTPWKWGYRSQSFTTSCKWLWEQVQGLGDAYTKRVPEWIRQSEPRIIEAFLRGAIMGDGWTQGKTPTYATVSRRLADDMQELFIKAGRSASVRVGRKGKKAANVIGSICNTQDQFWVTEWNCPYGLLRNKNNVPNYHHEQYVGRVYCATVPNGTLIVRRNGKPIIAGNCLRYGIMTGISLAIIRPFDQWAGRPGMPPKFAKKQGLESAYSPYSQAWSIGKIQHSQQPTGWFPGGQSPLKKN